MNHSLYSSILIVVHEYSITKIRFSLPRRAVVRHPNGAQAKSQPRITASLFPEVKRPMELLGTIIGVPGSEWGSGSGRVLAVEKATIFKCVLRDYICVHKFPNAVSPEKALQLKEMGVSGSGSLEHGD